MAPDRVEVMRFFAIVIAAQSSEAEIITAETTCGLARALAVTQHPVDFGLRKLQPAAGIATVLST